MASRRQRQVAELLHEEISQLIQHEIKDPRLGFITLTGVEVSPDLRIAWVYVTVLGDEADARDTLAGLNHAASYLKHKLGQSLSLRFIPELVFKLDTSLAYGLHIENLLDAIKEEEASSDTEADTAASPDNELDTET